MTAKRSSKTVLLGATAVALCLALAAGAASAQATKDGKIPEFASTSFAWLSGGADCCAIGN
jgi:hypothetical protein